MKDVRIHVGNCDNGEIVMLEVKVVVFLDCIVL